MADQHRKVLKTLCCKLAIGEQSMTVPLGSILTNGGFDTGATTGWTTYTSGTVSVTLGVATPGYDTVYAGRANCTAFTTGGVVAIQNGVRPAAVAGKTFNVSFKYKAKAAFHVFVLARDGTGTQQTSGALYSVPAAANWTGKSFTATLPATLGNAVWIDFRLISVNELYIDDVGVVPSSYVPERASIAPESGSSSQTPETEANRNMEGQDVIFIGNKPPMSYVLAIITSFSSGRRKEIVLKARGIAIPIAVDVEEITRTRFIKDLKVKNVVLGTAEMPPREGETKSRMISTIEIALSRA